MESEVKNKESALNAALAVQENRTLALLEIVELLGNRLKPLRVEQLTADKSPGAEQAPPPNSGVVQHINMNTASVEAAIRRLDGMLRELEV